MRREKAAEAAGREQIIAAKSQEEAMKHVLPFKQRQIEQRRLEAEAEKVARIRNAEGSAQARRIEANGEADAREKLAEAEVYRLERVGKANAEQMAREGALITSNPLLIQKTLADKLSDKIQVIIAPLADGRQLHRRRPARRGEARSRRSGVPGRARVQRGAVIMLRALILAAAIGLAGVAATAAANTATPGAAGDAGRSRHGDARRRDRHT